MVRYLGILLQFHENECKYDELWFRTNLHENKISLRKILSEVMQNKS